MLLRVLLIVVVTCGVPFTPPNGFILPRNQTTWFVGEMIRYMCEENYLLIGIDEITCLNDGTFGEILIDCLGKWLLLYTC